MQNTNKTGTMNTKQNRNRNKIQLLKYRYYKIQKFK